MEVIKVIALDLEGTLISNSISQVPRPHLRLFLDECRAITERVVIFTSVREEIFREIANLLLSEGVVPQWFAQVEYVHWGGQKKNLNLIPDAELEHTVLVDDVELHIADGQKANWVPIQQFSTPYPDTDCGLLLALNCLQTLVDQ